jgi:hypothetical protein
MIKNDETIWIAVKVERGFPATVKCFRTEKSALEEEETWRKDMNMDYDETGVFEVSLKEIN